MKRNDQVGFSQRIQLEWLEYTAALLTYGYSRQQIVKALQELLCDRLSVGGTAERTNRDKAITILIRIWVNVPPQLIAFRDDGLSLLQRLPGGDHLAVHWGMSMAVYPFWGLVAETVGRLTRLQGVVAATHVQRRVREQLGERVTVSRAARRVLRSFIDWGVLQETGSKGVYKLAQPQRITDCNLATWLLEGTLIAHGSQSGPLRDLLRTPSLFPFNIDHSLVRGRIEGSRLEYSRQAMDEEIISLITGPSIQDTKA